jgi:branched-chain amino acid aminotransferase
MIRSMAIVWLNGELLHESEAMLPIRDTGVLHAAGVFTTMRSYGGVVFRLAQHLQRIRQSCEALSIPLSYNDAELTTVVEEVLARNDLQDARLRLTVTRGSAREDPEQGLRLVPSVFLTATQLEPYPPEYYQRGMTAVVLDQQKLNPYDLQAGHKTLNYFSRLAGLRDANAKGAGEALWFNVNNFLESGSISNVFIVKNSALIIPPTNSELADADVAKQTAYPKSSVLPGIMRGAVLDVARQSNVDVKLGSITINDLLDADEVFVTNSIMEIMPICRIERRVIGEDKPGPVTRQLTKALRDLISAEMAQG